MTPRKRIVLIDDERAMRESISQWLTLADFQVDAYSNANDALSELNQDFEGVVVTDLKMASMDGMDVIKAVLNIDGGIPIILITGHGDINSAVTAMQLGAYDFIEKPFEPERLLNTIIRANEKRHLVVQNRILQQRLNSGPDLQQRLLGNSEIMRQLRNNIAEFSQVDINILLIGETGTGKEVIAQCLHDFGKRATKPFQAIDCGAIPADGFEVSLFGSVGIDGQTGQLKMANNGTLFLDEILNMPPAQQIKLLRVLQTGEIRPVGEATSTAIDIRVISAASDDLQIALKEERIRSDLYFRLNTIELVIPPLRDRGDDALLLFERFANSAAQLFNRALPKIENTDASALKSHQWPGNVRELKNIAERFVLYQNKRVSTILNETALSSKPASLQHQVLAFEKSMIEFALSQSNGNISDASEQLGMPRRTLNDKLIRHEIDRTTFVK